MATSRWISHKLPWRRAQYCLSAGSPRDVTGAATGTCRGVDRKQGSGEQADFAKSAHCPPDRVNRCAHFPFRKVIIGSKLINVPDKEICGDFYTQNVSSSLPVPKNVNDCFHHQQGLNADPARCLPTSSSAAERPVTPPLGRSAWLNDFLQFQLISGNVRDGNTRPGCPFPPYWKELGQATSQQILDRMKPLQENTKVYSTPMSHFRHDDTFLMNAIRTYRRDAELQKERGQFMDPKVFADQGNRDLYDYMMTTQNQAPLDKRTESALLRSDFVRVHDALGGCCYLDPRQTAESSDTKRVAYNTTFTDPLCQNLKPPVKAVSKETPDVRVILERQAEDNFNTIKRVANERDKLLEMLVETEQLMHEAKGKYYRLTDEEKFSARDLVQEIHGVENCQKKILDEVRCKESKLDDLMRNQHQLERHLSQQQHQDS